MSINGCLAHTRWYPQHLIAENHRDCKNCQKNLERGRENIKKWLQNKKPITKHKG